MICEHGMPDGLCSVRPDCGPRVSLDGVVGLPLEPEPQPEPVPAPEQPRPPEFVPYRQPIPGFPPGGPSER